MTKPDMKLVEPSHDDQKERRAMTNLKMADNFRLINYLIAEYTASGLSDADFAVKAAEALQIPGINASHIVHRRKEFDIQANSKVKVEDTDVATLAAQVLAQAKEIADLKERVAHMEGWINTTFPNKGPKQAVG